MCISPAPQQTQDQLSYPSLFSERELLPEPIEKVATRNMFYNEQKKHVHTKKKILDDSGNVRKGCKIIKKGEVYERTLFTSKNKLFKQEHYMDEAKRFYTDLINLLIADDKKKLHVFDRNGLYLTTKKIGKNNPKAEQIKALLTHMKTNGIREKRDSSTLACYEYEYVDDTGINCMDIFIAIE